MLVSMLAALMLASPVTLTEIINGDNRDNLLRGTARTDQIRGYGGNDKIQGEEPATEYWATVKEPNGWGPYTRTQSRFLGVSAKAGV